MFGHAEACTPNEPNGHADPGFANCFAAAKAWTSLRQGFDAAGTKRIFRMFRFFRDWFRVPHLAFLDPGRL